MRIWVVGRGIPCKENGMLGSFELEQAQALAKAGEDVVYLGISVRSARNLRNVGFSMANDVSVPAYSFNFPIGRFFSHVFTDKVFDMAFSSLSKRIVKEHGMPDIIHIHYPAQRSYNAIRKMQGQGVRIIATEHWTKVQDMTIGEISRRNLAAFVSECESFICVSSTLKQSVINLTGTSRKIEVVPNLVNSFFKTQSTKTDHPFNFLVSGRLVEHKQADKVVRTFIEEFDRSENVALTIAGGGEQFNTINGIIKKGNREKQIHLPGSVSRERMANIMASSDALISYSRLETFCVPVIEAWMCGKPVIVSATAPVAIDNRDERLGILVDCDDPQTLRKAMRKMYEQYAVYDSGWISDYAQKRFSEQSVAASLIEIYRPLVNEGHRE